MTTATDAELGLMEAVPGGDPGAALPEGAVLVVTLAPHKVGPPVRPDTRIKYWPGQQYPCARAAAEYAQARGLVYIVGEEKFDWWAAPGRVLSPFPEDADRPFARVESAGALRIAQGAGYDPGNAAFRFHAALNACTKHSSSFIRWGDTNPYSSLRQLDGQTDAGPARAAILTADVLHNHIAHFLLNASGVQKRPEQLLVIHYHGSRPDGRPLVGDRYPGTRTSLLEWDHARGARVVCARVSLVEEVRQVATEKGIPVVPEWLPIPVDVPRYRALVPADRPATPFRIAHSPTNRRFKGSDQFERVVARLRARGLPVEVVSIMGRTLGDALRLKATCHAVFDSFWLGLQGSGLEGAAMGLPVIAGDPTVRDLHAAQFGACPYTYANDEVALGEAIERLATDAAFYAAESTRVATFVREYHDYPAVARRYEQLLGAWLGRGDLGTERPTPKRRRVA